MQIFQAILLGIIQGITEWLPVSSSGHLVIFQQLFKIQADLLFDIILHFASLIVILFTFRTEVKKIITLKSKLTMPIIIGTMPIALAGFFLYPLLKSMFQSLTITALALIITGILLCTTKTNKSFRFVGSKINDVSRFTIPRKKISNKKSFIIGIAQAFALIPGISRSGATISTSLLLNIRRKQAAAFSFLLAVPAIIGALILELAKTKLTINPEIIIGFLTALVTGCLALNLLLIIINKRKLHLFAYYTIPLGIILLIYDLL